ncbi:hypothetical protein KY343_03345, partial [Candidatus Woesearchaeota archaeon]|nr:hypothetical protein [Candidatus Woesearchaeota archaeon]
MEFETTTNLQKVLKEKNLATNIIRWRTGKDHRKDQLINLDALLFIKSYVIKRRNKILNVYNDFRIKTDFSLKRIIKTKNLIFLTKEIRHVLGGNNALSKFLDINTNTLNHYINNDKIKTIPSNLVLSLLKIIEKKIINFTFSFKEIENKVLAYKSYHGKEIIPESKNKRKLPIKINPEFESIVYHLMGDGHVAEIGSSEYTQLNKISKDNFLKKLFNVFGYFDFSKKGYDNGRVYISK